MSNEHPYMDLVSRVRDFYFHNMSHPASQEPLRLYSAALYVLESEQTSGEVAAWYLMDAAKLNAPLKVEGEKVELDGTNLSSGLLTLLAYSITAVLMADEAVQIIVRSRPTW